MEITFALTKKDFVTFQLFVASKSARIKRSRKRSFFVVPVVFGFFGVSSLLSGDKIIAGFFFAVIVLWLVFYPGYVRKRYKAHYESFVDENYQRRFDREVALGIQGDYFTAKDFASESKTLISEIAEFYEIPGYLFINFATGHTHIIPKAKVENFETFKQTLIDLTSKLQIEYIEDQEWKWE